MSCHRQTFQSVFVFLQCKNKAMKNIFLLIMAFISCFAVSGQDNSNPITFPIQLRYLNAEKVSSNTTVIRWLAPCQTTDATFEVQHSTDAQNFSVVYSITANQQRCFEPFDFTDTRLLSGKNYYRIRLITPAKVSIHSYIIPVVSKGSGFELNSLWPSVITSSTVLNYSSGKDETTDFVIADINGRIIQSFSQKSKTGNNQLTLNISQYQPGYYVLQAVNAGKEKKIIRFQKL
jgi:Secretion system C-terminal sorting domain